METTSQKAKRIVLSLGISAVMIFLGYAISAAGYRVIRSWSSIDAAYAEIGILWLIAGPAILGAALWILASLGRQRIPFCVVGYAAVVAAVVLIFGVLSNIVPCSGPS